MNEWTVVTVLIALAGFGAVIIKPIVSLNSTITRLTHAVKVLEKSLEDMSAKNGEAHGRLWDRAYKNDEELRSYERRLQRLEQTRLGQ